MVSQPVGLIRSTRWTSPSGPWPVPAESLHDREKSLPRLKQTSAELRWGGNGQSPASNGLLSKSGDSQRPRDWGRDKQDACSTTA